MSKQLSKQEIENSLQNFTGTEQWYKYMLGFILTDGSKFLAESCGAFWLLDIIVSCHTIQRVRKERMQVYKLTAKNGKGLVTVEDGNKNELYRQRIPFTDFPLDEITLWCIDNENGTRTILLPSEY
jgi:hypothetical protein